MPNSNKIVKFLRTLNKHSQTLPNSYKIAKSGHTGKGPTIGTDRGDL